jgi:DNA-binding NtrC family response regulator
MGIFNELTDMKILLVDDDEWIRDSLSQFFEAEGCHLLALETAEEGVDALKSDSYDIIISDYRLPSMDGLEFFKLIGESHPDAIMILVTAYGNIDIACEAIKIGIHDLIQKPFTTETIEKSLSRLIEKHKKKSPPPC